MLLQKKQDLESEIEIKKNEVMYVHQPVEAIYFPENQDEVSEYLETLSPEQLKALWNLLSDVMMEQTSRAIKEDINRIKQENIDKINRMLGKQ